MSESIQFIPRLLCVGLIVLLLFGYQQRALGWDAEQKENEAAIAEANAYNEEIAAQEEQLAADIENAQRSLEMAEQGLDAAEVAVQLAAEEAAAEARSLWEDGSWTGSGEGFGGEIMVTVTTEHDEITAITVESAAGEDESYFSIAEVILDDILSAQTAEVDTISGATFSSTGLREAVTNALQEAEVTD